MKKFILCLFVAFFAFSPVSQVVNRNVNLTVDNNNARPGQRINYSWTSSAASPFNLYVLGQDDQVDGSSWIANKTTASGHSYWAVPTNTIPGEYKMFILGAYGSSSSKPIRILDRDPINPNPTVSVWMSPVSEGNRYRVGQATGIYWQSSNYSRPIELFYRKFGTIGYTKVPNQVAAGMSGTNGSLSWVTRIPAGNYEVTAIAKDGTNRGRALGSVNIEVNAAAPVYNSTCGTINIPSSIAINQVVPVSVDIVNLGYATQNWGQSPTDVVLKETTEGIKFIDPAGTGVVRGVRIGSANSNWYRFSFRIKSTTAGARSAQFKMMRIGANNQEIPFGAVCSKSVTTVAGPTLAVNFDGNASSITRGEVLPIKFAVTNYSGTLNLQYKISTSNTWTPVSGATAVTPATGFNWTVPSTLPVGSYTIKATTNTGSLEATKGIEVDAGVVPPPSNAGIVVSLGTSETSLQSGSSINISWTDSVSTAKVYQVLIIKNGQQNRVGSVEGGDTGTVPKNFSWQVGRLSSGTNIAAGSGYMIKVCRDTSNNCGYSQGFSLLALSSLDQAKLRQLANFVSELKRLIVLLGVK
ncbi:MAG: hypothetical protein WCO03_00755 [bacterium]